MSVHCKLVSTQYLEYENSLLNTHDINSRPIPNIKLHQASFSNRVLVLILSYENEISFTSKLRRG